MKFNLITSCCLLVLVIFLSNCGNKQRDIPIITFTPKAIEYDYSDSLLIEKIHRFFESRHRGNGFNGVALFAKGGKVIYHEAFGVANRATKDSLRVDYSFQLASVSKTITAVAVLKLVQDSLIQLDQTVQTILPLFPYENVTVRNLLSHRSGLPNYMYFVDQVWENKDSSVNNDEMLTIMHIDTPNLYYQPDVRYHYCNTNYAVLASIIEKVSNDTYEDYLDKHIFHLLEMDNAFVFNRNTQPKLPQQVIGYSGKYRKENHYFNGVVGDKGIYASVMDLFKFDRALYESDFIDQDLLNEAFEPHDSILMSRNRDNYGLGWRIQQPSEHGKVVYHSGWWKGFKTHFIRMIDKDQTIVVLTNVTRRGYLDRKAMQGLFN